MATLLADTDVCIRVLKKKNQDFMARFLKQRDQMAVSSVTAFELFAGAEYYDDTPRRCDVITEFLSLLEVIALDVEACRLAGKVHGQLLQNGMRIGSYDVLNAGLALSRDLTIATNNLREFLRVPGLKVEQWA